MNLPKNRTKELYALHKKFFKPPVAIVGTLKWSTPEALDVSQSSRKLKGDVTPETLSGNIPLYRPNWIYGQIQKDKALAII